MKKFIALLTLTLSISSFAQERVELSAKKIDVKTNSATLVRTNKSPDTIEVSFLVPMDKQVCERYETRYVVRTDGAYCGYDSHTRRVYVGKVCVRQNPANDKECLKWGDQYRTETIRVPRTCPVPETYCARYGTVTTTTKDTMKIKFKNLPDLGDSESETFNVVARQKNYDGSDVVYTVTPKETLRSYKVKQKKILFVKIDSYEISEKDAEDKE